MLPFTLKKDDWISQIIKRRGPDQYSYEDGKLDPRGNGIPEMKMFPVRVKEDGDPTGAGNWGTVDIGASNNSTADLRRQIVEGVSDKDLEPYDGILALDETTHTLDLNGDTGVSAGMKDALAKRYGREIEMVSEIDPSVLGGAVIYAGDEVIDGSLRGRLNKLQDSLAH